MNSDANYSIIAGSAKFIDSLRANGYKNTTYAIAELVDNAVDAGSTNIEILHQDVKSSTSDRLNLNQIAVLDNGSGMNKDALRRSLKFADGSEAKDGNIGKFGMGLPNSSISQCKHVDVYTWTKSIDKALYTYIDVEEIKQGMTVVPEPKPQSIPKIWINASKHLSKNSGTLVVWSDIDRASYKTSSALIKNSEELIGRIYRKFIHKNKIKIRTASFTASNDSVEILKENIIKPNDPLYLITPSSTPDRWGTESMFEKDGDLWEDSYIVKLDGKKHEIKIRYTKIRNEARPNDLSGSTSYGKHAARNVGVSLMRAERELDMDLNFVNTAEYRDRWWGVEVEFPPSLDDFFGVTNNKQGATIFSSMAQNRKYPLDDEKQEPQALQDLEDSGEELSMLKLIRKIDRRIRHMRDSIKADRKGTRSHDESGKKPEDIASARRDEKNPGHSTTEAANTPKPKRIQDAIKLLTDEGYPIGEATSLAEESIKTDQRFVWLTTTISGSQFFDVVPKSGQLYIKLNKQHAAYKNLVEIVKELPPNLELEDAKVRLNRIYDGLRLLIASWAQYEDETSDDDERQKIQDFRISWGKILQDFLKENVRG